MWKYLSVSWCCRPSVTGTYRVMWPEICSRGCHNSEFWSIYCFLLFSVVFSLLLCYYSLMLTVYAWVYDTLLPPIFVSKSGCVLYMLLEFFKFKNAFKSREIDPKRAGASYTRVRLIHECDLYTSATYTRVRLIHQCDLYTSANYTQVYTVILLDLSCLF